MIRIIFKCITCALPHSGKISALARIADQALKEKTVLSGIEFIKVGR
jgi:phosphotransferase system IIA component